jgi:tRNA nucleotidyltransferase (CCA-adding enzyme)
MNATMLEEAKRILDVLEQNGHKAYLVGGYARDKVAGRPSKDIDIATSAAPDEVTRLFERTVPTGLQHGTVTVIRANYTFEVTTFRTESAYESYRRPAEVQFVDELETDLQRRDFTMNAMAIDSQGNLIDPFGGRDDYARGLLRCVGEADRRFGEDALRMLRCVRFAAEYGLEIEPGTWAALLKQRDKLRHIAMERVRVECERMIGGRDPWRALNLLAASGLLARLAEPLALPLARWSAAELPPALAALGTLPEPPTRWALLMLAQRVGAAQARHALRQLKFARSAITQIAALVDCHNWLGEWLQVFAAADAPNAAAEQAALGRCWKLAAVRFGHAPLKRWLKLAALLVESGLPSAALPDGGGQTDSGLETFTEVPAYELSAPLLQILLQHGQEWLDEIPVRKVADLAIGGQDLMLFFGRPAGPWVGETLNKLFSNVVMGEAPNNAAALLELAEEQLADEPANDN